MARHPHSRALIAVFLLACMAIDMLVMDSRKYWEGDVLGMLSQPQREPLPIDVWQSWPIIIRMLCVAAIFFAAAVGVCSRYSHDRPSKHSFVQSDGRQLRVLLPMR